MVCDGITGFGFAVHEAFDNLQAKGGGTNDKDRIANGAHPAQGVDDRRLLDEFRTARPPQPFGNCGMRLDETDGQKAGEEHQHKAEVQTPEGNEHQFAVQVQGWADNQSRGGALQGDFNTAYTRYDGQQWLVGVLLYML